MCNEDFDEHYSKCLELAEIENPEDPFCLCEEREQEETLSE
jgi:hypothetical protein